MGSGGSRSLLPPGKPDKSLLRRSSRSPMTFGSQPNVDQLHASSSKATNALRLYGQASRAISTGQLSALLRVHTRPINHVVFVGPLGESSSQGDLVLGGASRLDAFSGYPVRT